MSKTKDGGPAFPVVEVHPVHGSRVDMGMSLRDYFAGHALSGLLADPNVGYGGQQTAKLCEGCYAIADSMLNARQK